MKITGIKRIASDSKELKGGLNDGYMQIAYNPATGEAWSTYHIDCNSYTRYSDPDIITCGFIHTPRTMKEIREIIEEGVGFAGM